MSLFVSIVGISRFFLLVIIFKSHKYLSLVSDTVLLLSNLLQSLTTMDKTANVVLDIESLVQSSDKTTGSPKMTVSAFTLVYHPIRRIYSLFDIFLLLSF